MKRRIVVIGTGYVGLPAALMWARAGHPVVGVDLKENLVRAINERTLLLNERELNELLGDAAVALNLEARTSPCEGDVFVIAVPTPVDPLKKVCELAAVRAAIASIAPHVRRGNLVLLESTVPPRTTRDVVAPMLAALTGLAVPQDVLLAHCPERILPGDVFREIVQNDRLLGGLDAASTRAAREAYAAFVKGELVETDDLSAELAKLMENTYRDVNIALANELAAICEGVGVEPGPVIAMANRHPRVDILAPGIGVGGHCIPVDPWFLKEIAPNDSRLISTARRINDEMPARTAARIRHAVRGIATPRIAAFGATYKRDCEDVRESPAVEVVRLLREDGYEVTHVDPLVPGMECSDLGALARESDLCVVLVAHAAMARELHALASGSPAGRFLFFDR